MTDQEVTKRDFKCLNEGALAARQRRPVTDCKYPVGSAERDKWLQGYRDQMIDDE